MRNYLKILKYLIPYKKYLFINLFFNLLAALFSVFSLTLIIPFLGLLFGTTPLTGDPGFFSFTASSIKDNFYYLLSSIITENGKINALMFICIIVTVMVLFRNTARYFAMYFIAPVRNAVVRDIRRDIYAKVLVLPLSFHSDQRRGDIIARMTTDVQEVEWSIMSSLETIFRDPVMLIALLWAMFAISPQLTLFVFILVPPAGYIIGRIGKSLRRSSELGQSKMGHLMSVVEETLTGMKIIKAFRAEGTVTGKFDVINESHKRLMTRVQRKRDLASPLSEFLATFVIVVVMWFGGQLVLGEKKSLGAEVFIGYIAIFSQLLPPAKSFTTTYYNILKGAGSIDRILQIIKAPLTIIQKPHAVRITGFNSGIEYRDVSFSYTGTDDAVLSGIALKIEKGKTIALVGPSGGGKTTLADLLPRFYDPSAGEIAIDNIPLPEMNISDLRNLMGIVTQESILFNDSVFNNIAFGVEGCSEEDVIMAARIANAHGFIMELENGYQTNIGDSGSKLSGGQRQRISIARAVLKNPPILILDEATSSLDSESERLVQEALSNLLKNRTSLIIAHRLSTIQHADEILVLNEGKIIERGTHSGLLATGGFYKKMYELQAFN
ncbi:MAG: ABC transporter ATP-binding protein [Bacteroidetes bacterium]|nr:ABC transporter ATP-binding protein [Bacteroidota bacterium]